MSDNSIQPLTSKVVYTTLFGNYESLNELEFVDPKIYAICFTDDASLVSSSWNIIRVEPEFPYDLVRSQRLIKVLGHAALEPFEEWLYVDNTVRLLCPASDLLDYLLHEADLAIPNHSFHQTLRDEFDAVLQQGLDSLERVHEQLRYYEEFSPSVLDDRPLWTGIIARRRVTHVETLASTWARQVLRHSRRDQLSLLYALSTTETPFRRIDIDNFQSDFHKWPVLNNRQVENRLFRGVDYGRQFHDLKREFEVFKRDCDNLAIKQEQLIGELSRVEKECDLLFSELLDARATHARELKAILESRSWRYTKHLRNAVSLVRNVLR